MVHVSATLLEKQITFQASFIYGFNTPEERLSLWTDIMNLRGQQPWILLGDFNIVRFPTERIGGNMDWPPYMEDLNQCCSEAHLEDLKATRFHLTWDNKGSVEQYKSRKLDRVLVNPAWRSFFPLSEAQFLPPGSSDHSPMTVTAGINIYKHKITFKFFNLWADHPKFQSLVAEVWSTPVDGIPLYQISQKLKILKAKLKDLNYRYYHEPPKKSAIAREALFTIQQQLNLSPGDEALRGREK